MANSGALQKFSERLREVETLIQLSSPPDVGIREQTMAAHKDNAVLRGALVLLCSHIEGFFEDLVGDALAAYEALAHDASAFPIEVRACQVIGKPGRWASSDSSVRWQIIQDSIKHPLAVDGSSIGKGLLNVDLHTRGFANPGTGEIESLLRTIGISSAWDAFKAREADKFVRDAVDAIVNRRNQIAHGNIESTVTRADVETYATRAKRVAEIMDDIVGDAIATQLGASDVWAAVQAIESSATETT